MSTRGSIKQGDSGWYFVADVPSPSGARNGRVRSKRTIQLTHSVIGRALSDAERAGPVQRNVARLASPPSYSSARPVSHGHSSALGRPRPIGRVRTKDGTQSACRRPRSGYDDDGYVFARPDGRPWNPEQVSRNRLVRATSLPRIRLHDLRHTHTTHLLAAGTNVRVVSERLGHASVSFTLDVYGHVLPGQQATAALAVADLVDRSVTNP